MIIVLLSFACLLQMAAPQFHVTQTNAAAVEFAMKSLTLVTHVTTPVLVSSKLKSDSIHCAWQMVHSANCTATASSRYTAATCLDYSTAAAMTGYWQGTALNVGG